MGEAGRGGAEMVADDGTSATTERVRRGRGQAIPAGTAHAARDRPRAAEGTDAHAGVVAPSLSSGARLSHHTADGKPCHHMRALATFGA